MQITHMTFDVGAWIQKKYNCIQKATRHLLEMTKYFLSLHQRLYFKKELKGRYATCQQQFAQKNSEVVVQNLTRNSILRQ